MEQIKCTLCDKPIENYSVQLNHFKIDDDHSANICQQCVDKFVKWQSSIFINLFPTKTMKKLQLKRQQKEI